LYFLERYKSSHMREKTPEPLARGRLRRPRSRSQPPPEVASTAAAVASPAVAATPGRQRRRAGMARPTDLLSRGGVVCEVERVEARRRGGDALQRSPACCGDAKRRRRGPCRRWRFPCGGGAAWRWRRLIPGAVGAALAAALTRRRQPSSGGAALAAVCLLGGVCSWAAGLGRSGADFFWARSEPKKGWPILIAGSRTAVWGLLVWPNKGGVLGFLLATR
jgi:hypothetical protein